MPSFLRRLFADSGSHTPNSRSTKGPENRYPTSDSYLPDSLPRTRHIRFAGYPGDTTRPNAPHPIYADPKPIYDYGNVHVASTSSSELRPQVLRRAGYNHTPGNVPVPLPLHTHYAEYSTPTSSRSNSSNSLFTPMSSAPYQYDTVHHATPTRPPLSANEGWQSRSSLSSSHYQPQPVAYTQPRGASLHMHPLLAYSKRHHAPISYDVTFTPSAHTVLDRATRSPIPAHTLAEPATDPPTPASGHIILRSHKLPWTVIVTSPQSSPSPNATPRFTVGPSSRQRSKPLTITNLDVCYAVHRTLLISVTPEEWETLGHGSHAQQKVTKAYQRRCTRMGGGWEGGVKRIDWLGEKTRLIGIEVDKNIGVGKLIFDKA